MLASSYLSFQMSLIHLLVERFSVRNYERRIGMIDLETTEWPRVHPIAIEAEAQHLRSVIGDPTLRFNYEEQKPNGTLVLAFRSQEGSRVFHVFRRATREVRGGRDTSADTHHPLSSIGYGVLVTVARRFSYKTDVLSALLSGTRWLQDSTASSDARWSAGAVHAADRANALK